MAERKKLKKGMFVRVNSSYNESQKQGWRPETLMKGTYATIFRFHEDVEEAVRISYKYMGDTHYCFIHYLDLDVVDEIPTFEKKGSYVFDSKNLDM